MTQVLKIRRDQFWCMVLSIAICSLYVPILVAIVPGRTPPENPPFEGLTWPSGPNQIGSHQYQDCRAGYRDHSDGDVTSAG